MPLLLLLQTQLAASQPRVELGTVGVNRAPPLVDVAMNRHTLALFPALDGTDVPFYIGGNFLPGIKGGLGGLARRLWRRDWRGILHIRLTITDLAEERRILTRGR
jgi:hypothetical protein